MREETFTADTKLSKVYNLPELKPVKRYLIYMKDYTKVKLMTHVSTIGKVEPNGNLLYGLERLRTVMKEGTEPICVYSKEEIAEDQEREHCNILFFPSEVKNSDKPFVIVIAGGAYTMVCSLLEGYPVARRFNELGYPAFVLNYRINNENGLFPKPLEDIAHALQYIYNHHDRFGLKKEHDYIIGGFSAGGHISAEWGTDNEGFLKYGLPAPKAVYLGYAAISSRFFISDDERAMVAFRESIVGRNYNDEMEERFSADLHVHAQYPPAYIVYNADDNMVVPNLHSKFMKEALDKAGIKNIVEEGETGGHGFGCGFHTSVEGWIDRAAEFFENL